MGLAAKFEKKKREFNLLRTTTKHYKVFIFEDKLFNGKSFPKQMHFSLTILNLSKHLGRHRPLSPTKYAVKADVLCVSLFYTG